jgi:hypothetical protein
MYRAFEFQRIESLRRKRNLAGKSLGVVRHGSQVEDGLVEEHLVIAVSFAQFLRNFSVDSREGCGLFFCAAKRTNAIVGKSLYFMSRPHRKQR